MPLLLCKKWRQISTTREGDHIYKFSFKQEYKQKIALVEYQGERNSERMESGKNEATKNK